MIEDTFLKLKSNLELSDTFSDTISRQHRAVRSVIENSGLDPKTKLIGSVARQTRIPPKPQHDFDIDILVELGSFYSWLQPGDLNGITTGKAMEQVRAAVAGAHRYAKMNPELDHPTVTFSYANDVKVEIVPAFVDRIGASADGTRHEPVGRAYWVPARDRWELADYDFERDAITAANKACGGWLVPVVKMVKAAKREHFPSMKSWHLEVIVSRLLPGILAELERKQIAASYPLLVASLLYWLQDNLDGERGISGSLSPKFTISQEARSEIMSGDQWLRRTVGAAHRAERDADKHELWKLIFKDVLPLP